MDDGIKNDAAGKRLTALRAIRRKCLDCSCGSSNEVKECPHTTCALYAFRRGKSPNRTPRVMSDEQRAEASARLAAAREKSKNAVDTI